MAVASLYAMLMICLRRVVLIYSWQRWSKPVDLMRCDSDLSTTTTRTQSTSSTPVPNQRMMVKINNKMKMQRESRRMGIGINPPIYPLRP